MILPTLSARSSGPHGAREIESLEEGSWRMGGRSAWPRGAERERVDRGERTGRECWPMGHGDTLLTVRIGRVKSAGLSRDRARTGSEPRGTVRAQHRSQNCRLEGQVWGGGT